MPVKWVGKQLLFGSGDFFYEVFDAFSFLLGSLGLLYGQVDGFRRRFLGSCLLSIVYGYCATKSYTHSETNDIGNSTGKGLSN